MSTLYWVIELYHPAYGEHYFFRGMNVASSDTEAIANVKTSAEAHLLERDNTLDTSLLGIKARAYSSKFDPEIKYFTEL